MCDRPSFLYSNGIKDVSSFMEFAIVTFEPPLARLLPVECLLERILVLFIRHTDCCCLLSY